MKYLNSLCCDKPVYFNLEIDRYKCSECGNDTKQGRIAEHILARRGILKLMNDNIPSEYRLKQSELIKGLNEWVNGFKKYDIGTLCKISHDVWPPYKGMNTAIASTAGHYLNEAINKGGKDV